MDILSDVNISGNLKTTENICAKRVYGSYLSVSNDCNLTNLKSNGPNLAFDFGGYIVYFCESFEKADMNISRTGVDGEITQFDLFSTISDLYPNFIELNVPSGCKEFFLDTSPIKKFPLIVAYDSNNKMVEMDYRMNDSCRILASIATDSGGEFHFKIV